MSLFFRRAETRSIGLDDIPWSQGGSRVGTVDSALRLIPFYAAVTGIADDVSVTPWHHYGPSGRDESPALLRSPAFGVGFIPWMNQGVCSALVHGFAFAPVVAFERGVPSKAPWIDPTRVQVDESRPERPVFMVDGKVIREGHYIYVPGPTLPGSIVGLSPVSLFRLQLSKGMNAQRYAADFFDRGIMPPGVLRNKARTLQPGAAQRVKDWFKESVSGRDIFVTGNDWEWNPLAVPRDDAAFLDTIKASATEIASIFRVAPEDIGGETGSSLTYTTTELADLRRNRRALLPWVRRFEQALTDALDPAGITGGYVKANLDALVRADLRTRMQSHAIGLAAGVVTNPEARALEDRPPLTETEIDQWQTWYPTTRAAVAQGGHDTPTEASR